ncbi:MAG: SPFH domain-containing protein, partial [Chloroflexi bacterium]|nr:SPFH domain-containing protein [Chloroflexota bacterium]
MNGELTEALGAGMQGIVLVIVVLAIFMLLRSAIRAIKEYDRLVIFYIGRFSSVRGPGLTFVIPFVESAIKVDMRETIIDIPSQTAITKDNASIGIDFLVYYRITDPELSVTKVEDVVEATGKIATTTLRAVIGDIVLDDVLSRRDQINDVLRVKLDETTERWGMKITTVEIREIEPPRAIQEAMNRQMSAERDRRAEVTLAEGERQAAIARAEGSKQSAILEAEGQ